jgi:hypothetical protein
MVETLLGVNGFPRSFTTPCAASAADTSRKLNCPPLGLLRPSALASVTTSGRVSARLLRPSHLPVARRLRLRAAARPRYLGWRDDFRRAVSLLKGGCPTREGADDGADCVAAGCHRRAMGAVSAAVRLSSGEGRAQ